MFVPIPFQAIAGAIPGALGSVAGPWKFFAGGIPQRMATVGKLPGELKVLAGSPDDTGF